ncbi:MAG: hypothetical protein M3Y07_07600, partial [Acidobacteriota bacterium]|nr:hypothetical protein [Acidobacteriota bacterium]
GELSGPLSHPFEIQANDRDDFVARLAGVECAWGSMTIRDGVAECHGDLTAIPARNRGAQRALIAARISAAASRGCDLAAAVVTPGSVAQRNYECAGLQLAYNRALMQLDLDPPEVPGPSVERQLSRILGSRAFRNCERLRKFLSFTVRRALEGCGHELKEYSIGIDVFNRGSEFDPRTDPIVRVHAGRLRGRVHDYYREEGSGDPVAIEFRKGSYIPAFEWRSKLNRSVRVTNDTVLRELLST